MNARFASTIACAALVPLLSFCAHDSGRTDTVATSDPQATDAENDFTYGRDPSTPKPFILGETVHRDVTVIEAPVEEVVEDVALVPVPVASKDPCSPVALSAGAVGSPCLTTIQFIKTLGLSKKHQAQAIAMVEQADSKLAH